MSEFDELLIAILEQAEKDLRKFPKTEGKDVIGFYHSKWFELLFGMTGEDFLQMKARHRQTEISRRDFKFKKEEINKERYL